MTKKEQTENKDAIIAILKRSSGQSAKAIACEMNRLFNKSMTAAQVGGILRSLKTKNVVASSNCGLGYSVYWLVGDDNNI